MKNAFCILCPVFQPYHTLNVFHNNWWGRILGEIWRMHAWLWQYFGLVLQWWGGMKRQDGRNRVKHLGGYEYSPGGNHKKHNPLIWLDAFPRVACSWHKLSFHWLPVVQPSALESNILNCHTDLNTTQRQKWREETPSLSLGGTDSNGVPP